MQNKILSKPSMLTSLKSSLSFSDVGTICKNFQSLKLPNTSLYLHFKLRANIGYSFGDIFHNIPFCP